ncbi:MAG: hypothetical protein COA47_06690 [Robiginitomaculum sp.]|nr:MAG: hypothetical protein COA47_06690 [Robiginitomaculum sp.]
MSRSTTYLFSALLAVALTGCSQEATPPASSATDHDAHALDQREKLHLTEEQRHHVLIEMRQMLASTQGMIAGIADDDMTAIAVAAKLSGPKAKTTIDMQMRDVLPDGFRPMGKAIHVEFGQMAELASTGASKEQITAKLADAMNLCVACHNTYQIELVE